jgi:hypothetical protein
MIHPAGDGAQQPESLRLCTFAALRWFNWPFYRPKSKEMSAFPKTYWLRNCAIGD